MTPYEKNLRAFVKLIESRGLTALEQTELLQLAQQSNNNLEQLAKEIIQWCQATGLENELANYRRALASATSAELIFPGQSPTKEAGNQAVADLLINAIQTSVPPKPVPTPAPSNTGAVSKPSEKKP